VWTTKEHWEAAEGQSEAREQQQRTDQLAEQDRLRWQQNHEALEKRQLSLLEPTRRLIRAELGDYPQVVVGNAQDLEWGGGIPVRMGGQVRAVVCPVATRITEAVQQRLHAVVVVVADERERSRVRHKCVSGTRIEVLAGDPVPDRPAASFPGNPLSQALRRMTFGGR